MKLSDAAAPLILYDYWRSSASYRVRIALNLKGLDYGQRPVHLVRDGGEQRRPEYTRVNPQALVPSLLHGERTLTQSLAICEYLDETFPQPPLLPEDAPGRARVRGLAQAIACDIHPLNNLRVLQYLADTLAQGEDVKTAWYRHWVTVGLDAFERALSESGETGKCCHGDEPTLADCCLIPQMYNARRFQCDETNWPAIGRICDHLEQLPAFVRAKPEAQPDAD